jgi:hypothetical protein
VRIELRPDVFDLQEAERKAQSQLAPELREHIRICGDAVNTLAACVSSIPAQPLRTTPDALKVGCSLMNRLFNTVHCAIGIAVRGYPAEVLTLISSAFEIAHCIAAIGDSESRAKAWIEHDDPTRPFLPIKTLLRHSLERIGAPQTSLDAEYLTYRQLCLGKHANPLLQRQLGIEAADAVTSFNGPDCSQASIRAIQFALEHATRLVTLAARCFVKAHVASGEELLTRIDSIATKRQALERKSITRWGREDPTPGRW